MFRRADKDENAPLDENQTSLLPGGESTRVLTQQEANAMIPQTAPRDSSSAFVNSYTPRAEAPAAPRQAAPAPAAAAPAASSFRPAAAPEAPRARTPEQPKAASSFSAPSSPISNTISNMMETKPKEVRRVLTVGSDILLKGEVSACDHLLIQGKVDAVLNDVGTVELTESGSFKGTAHVENAEISGVFDGELVVKGRLVVYASGRIRGKITYGEIEIHRGGEVAGEIKTINAVGHSTRTAPAREAKAKEDKVAA